MIPRLALLPSIIAASFAMVASLHATSVFEVLGVAPGGLGRSGQSVNAVVLSQLPMTDCFIGPKIQRPPPPRLP